MNIKVFVLGERFEKFYQEAIKEYDKRLSRYCKISMTQVKNHNQLVSKIPLSDFKILVTTQGTVLSSEELAEKMKRLGISR